MTEASHSWPADLHRVLKANEVRQMAYVPDAGHTALINLFHADPDVTCNVLTTEEEGIAIAAGAWLGCQRSGAADAVERRRQLHQYAVAAGDHARAAVDAVTMRGEWAEFNPWQVPMSGATEASLNAVGVRTMRGIRRWRLSTSSAPRRSKPMTPTSRSPC